MPALLISPTLYTHPSTFRAGSKAMGLWVRAGLWCAANSPTFTVPRTQLHSFRVNSRTAGVLVDVEFWRTVEDGWQFVPDRKVWAVEFDRHPRHRPRVPAALRAAVLERDGHACVLCGSTEALELDHVFPWSLGGQHTFANLQTLCKPCNRAKGARV